MITAATSGTALWYLARGTGLVSIVLLTAVVVLGVTQVQRYATEGWPRFVIAGLHKNLSLLVVVFLGIHIASSVIDAFAPIPWIAALVPYASSYRPFWLGLGALSFDLLIALVVTSLVRQRLGLRAWRAIHWTAYACWPLAFVHGLGTGSDGRVGWVQVLDLACLAAVVASVGWRLASGWERDPARRAAGAIAGAVLVFGVAVWAASGPTQAGWSHKAGTPASVLAKVSGGSASGATATDPGSGSSGSSGAVAGLQAPFTADIAGTLTTTSKQTTTTVTIDATMSNGAAGRLHLQISGPSAAGGGVRLGTSTVTMGPLDQPTQYSGAVTSLSGGEVSAALKSSAGDAITVVIQLQLDDAAGTATGTVSAEPA